MERKIGRSRNFLARAALGILLLCVGRSAAQTGNEPAATLRDALSAACSQDSTAFAKTLTARNTEAFARLTPAAQTTFLKRFVLLDKPGTPSVHASAAGNTVIVCVTEQVTTEMEVGKSELRDNLAYVPLTVKDASDTVNESAHKVTMGLVRESGQWKILSLGLLFLDLPTLEVEWDRAEMKSNEQSAVVSLHALVDAIESYRKTYTRLPDSLAALGPAAPGVKGAAKTDHAGLLTEELAGGKKDGYRFRYVIVGANTSGAPAKYELAAIPTEYGRTGLRSFFYDSSGNLHAADHHGSVGDAQDPKLDDSQASSAAGDPPPH